MKNYLKNQSKLFNHLLSFSLIMGGLNLINPLITSAQETNQNNLISIDYETPAFQNKIIEFDPVKISVSYKPYDYNIDDEAGNLTYDLYYNNQLQLSDQTLTVNWGEISFQNFDNDNIPEVVVNTFTGGAHCCTNNIVYHWQEDQFNKIDLGFRDGGGGEFKDLDQDGNMEFVTFDNAFLYRFSSYVASFPPTMILTFRNSNFENVTTEYPDYLRETLDEMYQRYREVSDSEYPEVNGILAGYVAQKILLDEYEEGWEFMLNHYDQNSDNWGLDIYDDNGELIGSYPDFPTALKAFLIKQGYLNNEQ